MLLCLHLWVPFLCCNVIGLVLWVIVCVVCGSSMCMVVGSLFMCFTCLVFLFCFNMSCPLFRVHSPFPFSMCVASLCMCLLVVWCLYLVFVCLCMLIGCQVFCLIDLR